MNLGTMEKFVLYIAATVLGYFIIYLTLKKKIEKFVSPAEILDQIREEINRVIVELNQATHRNISLIEDRINRLMELLAKADKKISLLHREGEKHEVGKQVYTRIAKNRTAQEAESIGSEGKQEEVLRLHEDGFSAPMIAKRVGTPLGEVELIISLSERKR